ncbi:MAG: hypothetical protein WCV85_00615 [Patescibacteria group bacterium]|jgi:hypothetical protein
MTLLFWGGPILVGFVLGYFLALPVLIGISVLCLILALLRFRDWSQQEIGQIFTVAFVFVLVIGNASMWVTYYFASNQHWIGDFFQKYIFR